MVSVMPLCFGNCGAMKSWAMDAMHFLNFHRVSDFLNVFREMAIKSLEQDVSKTTVTFPDA